MKMNVKVKYSICSLTLICAITLFISSCSKIIPYRDDVSCIKIAENISEHINAVDGYSAYGEEQIDFFFEATELPDDYALLYSTQIDDINEIGVFHCADKDSAQALSQIVSSYVEGQQTGQKSFISSYAPKEVPKLENAQVRTYGNYVIYLILNSNDQLEAWETVEKMLQK